MENKLNLSSKSKCCGCLSCKISCPKKAIEIIYDDIGTPYASINEKKCIQCGICANVCNYKNKKYLLKPLKGYVALTKNIKILNKSTSGGIFSTIAQKYLKENWKICGCIGYFHNEQYIVEHILTNDWEKIEKKDKKFYFLEHHVK